MEVFYLNSFWFKFTVFSFFSEGINWPKFRISSDNGLVYICVTGCHWMNASANQTTVSNKNMHWVLMTPNGVKQFCQFWLRKLDGLSFILGQVITRTNASLSTESSKYWWPCGDIWQVWMCFKAHGTLIYIFANVKMFPMKKLTNGTLVTPTLDKMDRDIVYTTHSNAIHWMKSFYYNFTFNQHIDPSIKWLVFCKGQMHLSEWKFVYYNSNVTFIQVTTEN